jgi:hypothetical protein
MVVNLPAKGHHDRLRIIFGEIQPQYCTECGNIIVYTPKDLPSKQTCSVKCNNTRPATSETKERRKNTCLLRYGSEYAVGSKQAREKSKQTSILRYGVDHPMHLQEVKDKVAASTFASIGVTCAFLKEDFYESKKKVCLTRYGVEHQNQSPLVQAKRKATCQQRYGVDHVSQDPSYQERTLNNRYRRKLYKLGTKNIYVQGYEPQALDYLLSYYRPKDILHGATKIPVIKYKHFKLDKVYFPDFYISKHNLLIEVKSHYTFLSSKEKFIVTRKKALACLKEGFNYQMLLMGEKGPPISLPVNWMYLSYPKVLQIFKSKQPMEPAKKIHRGRWLV